MKDNAENRPNGGRGGKYSKEMNDSGEELQKLRIEWKDASLFKREVLKIRAAELKKEPIKKDHVHKASMKTIFDGPNVIFICNCGEEIGRDVLLPR